MHVEKISRIANIKKMSYFQKIILVKWAVSRIFSNYLFFK